VLLLQGRQTRVGTFFTGSARFITQHVVEAQTWN
jgi:hypothetical protein